LKVARFIRQENLENYHVFRGGDHDLLLIPVDTTHALLLAGKELAKSDRILQTVEGMLFVRGDVANVLRSLGVTTEPVATETAVPAAAREAGEASPTIYESEVAEPEPDVDVDAIFASASKSSKVQDLDAFWDDAVEKTGSIPINRDVITFEDARKLGFDPGNSQTIPLRQTGSLKKK
jgi:septal ring-binding cell division protein DamX